MGGELTWHPLVFGPEFACKKFVQTHQPHFSSLLPSHITSPLTLPREAHEERARGIIIYIYIYINAPYSTIQVLYALLWSSHLQTARHRLKMIQYHPLWQSPRPGPWIVGFWGSCVRRSGKDDRFVLFSLKINKVVTGVEFWKGGGYKIQGELNFVWYYRY